MHRHGNLHRALLLIGAAAIVLGVDRATAEDGKPFTVAVVPDTQGYTEFYPKRFDQQTQWLIDNRQKRNIVFVSMLGDIVQHFAQRPAEWKAAVRSVNILHRDNDASKAALIPYAMAIGNHDYDRKQWIRGTNKPPKNIVIGSKRWLRTFGPIRFRGKGFAWYGGDDVGFRHGEKVGVGLNTYQIFRGGGRRWLHLSLELGVPDSAIAWAKAVLAKKENAGLPTIVSTHAFIRGGGQMLDVDGMWQRGTGNTAVAIWQKLLSKHSQIFLVLCGHTGFQHYEVKKNDAGEDVHVMMVCYTGKRIEGDKHRNGAGWMRLLEFDPTTQQIHCTTYSPTLKAWATNRGGEPKRQWLPDAYDPDGKLLPGKQSDFLIKFDWTQRFGPAKRSAAKKKGTAPYSSNRG